MRSTAATEDSVPDRMGCAEISYSGHAIRRMFERGLEMDAVLQVVTSGEVVASYPEDQPYPSDLLLGYVRDEAVHVVVAREPESGQCFVVTAYYPDPARWSDDFRTRR